ncbi:hypothetical protein BDA96_05G181200 [Sorghum bicolor]|uniref:Obtusifoliol 14-alpha demethylase n=1 Tax=Sorghum bicolor TaxID=4558 RepID=A0A921UHX4_SORBI|nr:hypothetical protein BDA96_05G181200 [Sorghum bicolor]
MDATNGSVWLALAIVLIIGVITKALIRRNVPAPVCNRLPPPVANNGSIVMLLHAFLTKGFHAMIQDQYTKLGSVFTVSIFGLKATFLVGPEVLGQFFEGMPSEIAVSPAIQFFEPILGKETYGIDTTTHYWLTGFMKDALKSGKLRSMAYFSKWEQHGITDLKQEMKHVLMAITARCLVGKEFREQMMGETWTLFYQLFDNGTRLTSVLFPYAPLPSNRRRDKARAKLSKILTQIVQSRRGSDHVEDDVLQILTNSKYKDGRPTTEEEVVGLIIFVVLTGLHSSNTTSTWTGALLLNNPRWSMAAVEEQQQIMQKHGCHLDYNVFLEMEILHNCIKEVVRLHPVPPLSIRKAHKAFSVRTRDGTEYEIPGGHTIVSPTLLNGSIPHIYKNPNVFDPDRFGPGREEDRVGGKFSYTSFGGGRHACLGQAYAYLQIKVIWSHLLRNFEMKLESPFPVVDRSTFMMEAKGKIMVSYRRRQLPASI